MTDEPSLDIFICYRHDDAAAHAGRLADALAERFGRNSVFMDVDTIEPGVDFTEAIDRAIGHCDVLIALIGPHWLDATNVGGRRLEDPQDLVRLEIEAALGRNIRVIPTLVGGARMPHADQLPGALARMAKRNAFELSDKRFRSELQALLEPLERIAQQKRESTPPPANKDLEVAAHSNFPKQHRLRDLARPERFFQLVHPDIPSEFPPLRSLDTHPTNLPLQLTSFIGREKEQEQVRGMLTQARMVTLVGAGGSGKTRLAMQVAADLVERYPDGVWFVDLAPIADSALLAQSIATSLGVREQPGRSPLESVLEALEPKTVLLLLDNCEQVIDAAAQIAETLLVRCPHASVLATSREGLRIPGERTFMVPPMQLPKSATALDWRELPQFDAVRLFIDRAVMSRATFALSDRNATAVVQICRRLDGIPLALELAAAQVGVLTPEDILARLHDRFRLLAGGRRTALPRQHTLRAAVEWSHNLLSAREKTLFRRMAVFSGGFDLEAAESVCSDGAIDQTEILELLTGLVEKSLVVAEEGALGRARYRLLETLREFALEQLLGTDETEPQRRRHAEYCLRLADDAEARLRGAESDALVTRLNEEDDNLRAALTWAIEKDGALAMRLASSLTYFWRIRSHLTEGRRWLARALDSTVQATAVSARTGALICASDLAYDQGDYAAMPALLGEALELARRTGDKRSEAIALMNLGIVSLDTEEYAAGTALVAQSLALSEEIGDQRSVTRSRLYLAVLELSKGNLPLARELYGPVVKAYRERADSRSLSVALQGVAMISVFEGDGVRARRELAEGLELSRRRGDKVWIARSIHGLACLAASESQAERAIRLRAAAEAIDAHLEVRTLPKFYRPFEESFEQMKEILGPETAASVEEQGRRLSLDEACELALQSTG